MIHDRFRHDERYIILMSRPADGRPLHIDAKTLSQISRDVDPNERVFLEPSARSDRSEMDLDPLSVGFPGWFLPFLFTEFIASDGHHANLCEALGGQFQSNLRGFPKYTVGPAKAPVNSTTIIAFVNCVLHLGPRHRSFGFANE